MEQRGTIDRREAFEIEQGRKLDEFNAELSGTVSGRIEKYGVGPDSKAAQFETARKLRTRETFLHLASMASHQQIVTLNLGGRNVDMSLADLRGLASELRNKHGATDRARSQAYDGLLSLIDRVAEGTATQEELNDYIDEHDLGEEIYEAAQSNPEITVSDLASEVEETANAGAHADQSASERNADLISSTFG